MTLNPANPPYPEVPVLEKGTAIAMLIVNVLFSGIGTMVAAVMGKAPNQTQLIIRGLLQFVLAFILVGWIWALVTGVQLLKNADWAESNRAAPVPYSGTPPS